MFVSGKRSLKWQLERDHQVWSIKRDYILLPKLKAKPGPLHNVSFFFVKFCLSLKWIIWFQFKNTVDTTKKLCHTRKKDESNWNLKFLFYCLVLLHFPKCFLPVQTLIDILYRNKRWFPFSKFDFCAGTKVYEDALNMIKFLDLHNEK